MRRAMRELLAGKTVILISQKIVSVKEADHIIFLDKGQVAAEGTHEELMQMCAPYREIYEIQCSRED